MEKSKENKKNQENKDFKAPIFAKKHRWIYVVLQFLLIGVLFAGGIGMLVNPKGNNVSGVFCIVLGVVYLIYYICQFSTEFRGKDDFGKLIEIGYTQFRYGKREHAVVEFKGKKIKVSLPFEQQDNIDGVELIKNYVGKEVPLKVCGRKVMLNLKKMYLETIKDE